jgi:hypothetical protein
MAVIGSKTFDKGDRKYFYKITRNASNDLILTKVEITNSQGENIVLNDPSVESAETQHVFQGFKTDYTYVNVGANKDLIDPALGVSQYKIRTEDTIYFVNDDGNLIMRLNT